MPRRYPLSTLLEARQRAKESAELSLAQQVSACELAERRELEVQSRLEVATQRLRTQAQDQLRLAEQGVMTALELQAGDRCRQATTLEIARIARQLEEVKLATAAQRSALERARKDVVSARQELAIVERHQSEFVKKQSRTAELLADEQAADAWAAMHHLPNSRSR